MTTHRSGTARFSPLRERLRELNHWWPENEATYQEHRAGSLDVTRSWRFYKADFIQALAKLGWSESDAKPETQLFAIAGPENTGKTTILSQIVKLFADDDFRELLWSLPSDGDDPPHGALDRRAAWAIDKYYFDNQDEGLVSQLRTLGSDRVLYLPLKADPAFQLRPREQLRDAIEYYECEILDGEPRETRHYVLIDDLDTLADGSEEGWGELIADLTTDVPSRKVVATIVSDAAVERELYDPERDRMRIDPECYEVGTVLPLKFRDYLQRRYPIFEGAAIDKGIGLDYGRALRGDSITNEQDPDTYRISGSTLRTAIRDAITENDPRIFQKQIQGPMQSEDATTPEGDSEQAGGFEQQLDEIYELVGRGGSDSPRAWIQNALEEYLLLGGYSGLSLEDRLFEESDERFRDYLRGNDATGTDFARDVQAAVDRNIESIHEYAPTFGAIKQTNTRDLTRLYAWAAHRLDQRPLEYDELLREANDSDDWVLDVDRRTLRDKYFETLEEMVFLTFSDGYGQQKPRELRVALRDVGLANGLLWRNLDDIQRDDDLRSRLEYMAAFDHVMRFTYNVNHACDPNCGVVKYWFDGEDFVEFIPKVWGAPVPIGFDVSSDTPVEKIDAVGRFLDGQSAEEDAELHDFVRYEPAVGEPRTGPSGGLDKLSGWFNDAILDALEESDRVSDLNDLWAASVNDLSDIAGIDSPTAKKLVAAVELYNLLSTVRGIGSAKRQKLWNPPQPSGNELSASPEDGHWTVETLAAAPVDDIAMLPGFTDVTAERVVQAAQTRVQQTDGGEFQRRLDRLLNGDGQWWSGVGEAPTSSGDYRGWYQQYTWGETDDDGDGGGSGPIHHRVHDGEASFGLVLTGGSSVDRYESPEKNKPIFTLPVWMFLSLA